MDTFSNRLRKVMDEKGLKQVDVIRLCEPVKVTVN